MAHAASGALSRVDYEIPDYLQSRSHADESPGPLAGHTLVVSARGGYDLSDDGMVPSPIRAAARRFGNRWTCLATLRGWDRWRLPRGIPWTDLPVVLPPRTRGPVGAGEAYGPSRTAMRYGGTVEMADALRSPRETVVAMPAGPFPGAHGRQVSLLLLAACADLVEAAGADGPVWLLDGEEMFETDLGGLREACAPAEPYRRFHYSWHLNFLAIGAKAVRHALALTTEADVTPYGALADSRGRGRTPASCLDHARILAREGRSALTPLGLQMLYGIARRGEVDVSLWLGPYGEPAAPVLEALLLDGEGNSAWRGTGKHSPLPVDAMEATFLWQALEGLCLVEVVGGTMRVAPAGHRLIESLHPDCEDPDLPCRWAHRPLGPAEGKAMDASLIRTFRKMKTKVNAVCG